MTQQERSRRTRERVLSLTAEEMAENGYARTNLQTVADRLGMTKGALYGHFASKEALAEALEDEAAGYWRELRERTERPGLPPEQALHETTLGLARLLTNCRMRAAMRLAADGERQDRAGPNLLEEVRRCLLDQLRHAHRRGLLAPGWPPELAIQVLIALIYVTVFAGRSSIGEESPALREEVARAFLTSLRDTSAQNAGADRPDRPSSRRHLPKTYL